jgi:hypothetical protein
VRIEVLSLRPVLPFDGEVVNSSFHYWPILGRVTVTDPDQIEALRTPLLQDLTARNPNDAIAMCFNPRHGLIISTAQSSLEVVVCYECRGTKLFVGEKQLEGVQPTGAAEHDLNALIDSAGIDRWTPAESGLPEDTERPNPGMQRTRYARR